MSKSAPTFVIRLQANLAPQPLARALRRSNRQTDCGRRALAYYLFDMQDRGIHQLLGFASATHFAVERLDMKRRTARDLIAVGRALAELPLVDRAFAEGRISWTKLRLLARICVPETQSAWLEKAESLSLSEFERLVSTSEAGRPPREGGHGLPVTKVDPRLRLNVVEHELLEQVRLKVAAETGEEISTRDVVLLLGERYLREQPEGDPKTRTEAAGESLFRVHMDHCPSCRESQVRTLDGPVPIPANLGDTLLCEGKRSVADAPTRGAAAPPKEGAKPGEMVPPAFPALRRRILALLAERTADRLSRPISDAAARLLARVAHGTPRRLIALVRCARDVAVARSRPEIDVATVREALCARGIDERGLELGHRRTLDHLRGHDRPLGRRRLASQLGMAVLLFLDAVEPLLLRLLNRVMRGSCVPQRPGRTVSSGRYPGERHLPAA